MGNKKIMSESIDELKNPSWFKDLKLLLRDAWFLGRDFAINITHLVLRLLKVITAMELWGKNIANYIEDLLHKLRDKVWINGNWKFEDKLIKWLS